MFEKKNKGLEVIPLELFPLVILKKKAYFTVTGYRYLYCLTVQAGFYSDTVGCRTLSPADRVQSPVAEKCYFHFFTCYIWRPT